MGNNIQLFLDYDIYKLTESFYEMSYSSVVARLRAKRKSLGLKQPQVSQMLGNKNRDWLSSVEIGRTELLLPHIFRLCEIYEMNPMDLFIPGSVPIHSIENVNSAELSDQLVTGGEQWIAATESLEKIQPLSFREINSYHDYRFIFILQVPEQKQSHKRVISVTDYLIDVQSETSETSNHTYEALGITKTNLGDIRSIKKTVV